MTITLTDTDRLTPPDTVPLERPPDPNAIRDRERLDVVLAGGITG